MVVQPEQHDQRDGRRRLPPADQQERAALHLRRRPLQVRLPFDLFTVKAWRPGETGSGARPGRCLFRFDSCLIPFASAPRSIHLAYVEDVEVKGIQAFRFAPPEDVLMSPKDNPANAGFCVPAGDCLGTGVLKVSVCREGRGPPLDLRLPRRAGQRPPKTFQSAGGVQSLLNPCR